MLPPFLHLPCLFLAETFCDSDSERAKNPLAPTQNSSVHQLTAKDRDQTDHKVVVVVGVSKQEQQKGFLS